VIVSLLTAALAYAARGWYVHPLHDRSKLPRLAWGSDASTDPDTIRSWWGRWPRANLGIVTGARSGLVVVDVDGPVIPAACSPTLTARTARGWHLYYRHPGGEVRNRAGVLEHLDVRGDGGYVVAPPSLHESGHVYAWADQSVPLAPYVPIRPAAPAPVRHIPEGQRNDSLYRIACAMYARGEPEERVRAELLTVNARDCEPPLDEREVETLLGSARRVPRSPVLGTPVVELVAENADLGNADLLVAHAAGSIRYCDRLGADGWLYWDGAIWQRNAGAAVQRLYADMIRALARGLRPDSPDDSRRWRWLVTSLQAPRVHAAIDLARARPGVGIDVAQLDADPWLLSCRSGTLDLRHGEVRDPNRGDYITRQIPTTFEWDATCPVWDAFLERVVPDPELRAFLQRAVGYSLSGSTREQVMMLLYGTGANGKSTFVETLSALLGDYATSVPFETFTVRRDSQSERDYYRLYGARLVTAIEAEPGARLAESFIKRATGGDTVPARPLYSEGFDYRPTFKLWLATNHRPTVRGRDEAIWRRILLVPFTVTIPPAERDGELPERLSHELPGILRWAFLGASLYYSNGLALPETVSVATKDYRREQDWWQDYIDESCITGDGVECSARALYASYKAWADSRGERPLSQRAFGLAATDSGIERYHARDGWYYKNVTPKA
jgi:putative DNA primase/helicase